MRTSQKGLTPERRQLVLLADGGALADFSERLVLEGAPRKDFARLPDTIIRALSDTTKNEIVCPIESRIFCNVGFEKAQSFVARMEPHWTVRTFPLTVAKYEREVGAEKTSHRFRLRFHAYIGYALGLLTAEYRQIEAMRRPMIGIVSDDPHLIPCMGNSLAMNVDVRLIWWASAIADEVSYLAARNGVKTTLIQEDDASGYQEGQEDAALLHLLSGGKSAG